MVDAQSTLEWNISKNVWLENALDCDFLRGWAGWAFILGFPTHTHKFNTQPSTDPPPRK
jgi:hypothetical protein